MSKKLFFYFPTTKQQYEITSTTELVSGRAATCGLALGKYLGNGGINTISSRHFKVYYENEIGFLIVDLFSTNGTQINGEALLPNQPKLLRNGDVINSPYAVVDLLVTDLQSVTDNARICNSPGNCKLP